MTETSNSPRTFDLTLSSPSPLPWPAIWRGSSAMCLCWSIEAPCLQWCSLRWWAPTPVSRWPLSTIQGLSHFSAAADWPPDTASLRVPRSASGHSRDLQGLPKRCHSVARDSREAEHLPMLNTWIPRISVPGFRASSAKPPLISCSHISDWAGKLFD